VYIGYYRAVNKAKEFYSEKRKTLNFPTQVEYMGERYLLITTHFASSKKQEDNIRERAFELGIPYDIELD
jgi:ribosomal protein S15P/S13E